VVVRFGELELDALRRELRRGGDVVHLEPQAFDLLVVLVEHRDRVLSKIELLDGVWGHRFVSDANLTTRIKEIRRAVGDTGAQQHTIRNLRGRGYRFVAEVVVTEPEVSGADAGLIGRHAEIAVLIEALGRTPLVTLTGPGGVGKSTLARVVAERVAPSYTGGVRVVELSAIGGGEQVLPAVARSLDVVLEADRPERAVRSIGELDVLLVLDNCEHVIDDVSSLIHRVIGVGGRRLGILATSQVRLGLSVEHVVAVDPLGLDRAIDLFTLRARAVVRTWALDEVGRDRVAALLAGLDQLPLAIEMAAARLSSMTFDDLERAIGAGVSMPMSHRSPMRHHRSLESLATWSAELLDASLRRTFTEFAVFAGSVTAADAAAVLGLDESAVLFDLAALAERSLLTADVAGSASRFRMLVTVRAVAGRWLEESSTADEVRRRHARHYTEATRIIDLQLRTPSEADARQRLDAITGELRAAHSWARRHEPELASAMSGFLHLAVYSTFWNEPVEWSRLLLAENSHASHDELLGARIVAAGADANSGGLAAARATATALSKVVDPRVRAAGVEILADVAIYDGHLEEAAGLSDELRQLGDDLGDWHAIAMSAVDASLALAFDYKSDSALEHLRAIDLEQLSPSDRAWIIYAGGEALSAAGDPGAVGAYAEAVEIARMIGNPFVTSVARMSLATELARAGRFRDALDHFGVCLRDYARHGNFVHAVTTLRNLVGVLVAIGDDHGATVLAGATASDELRPSYGIETAQLSTVVADIERRAGTDQFATWTGEGRLLDLAEAVQTAADLVDHHRTRLHMILR
jgi:predicted ATPase/DNA-binding winged helix-turn-helix (wHTH) protein